MPLITAIGLSTVLHGIALYSRRIHAPPKPILEQGQTVVHLTLVPSIARPAATPEPPVEKPIEQAIEEVVAEAVPIPVEKRVEQPPDPPLEAEPEHIAETPEKTSEEQDASLIEEKGVVAEARPTEGISATYPRLSQRRGEEGTVLLTIEVLANGRAGKVEIEKTSGHRRLDEAAVKAAKKTTYTPAKRFGRNVDSILIQPLTFELTNHD